MANFSGNSLNFMKGRGTLEKLNDCFLFLGVTVYDMLLNSYASYYS
jgi:hypothetical protein